MVFASSATLVIVYSTVFPTFTLGLSVNVTHFISSTVTLGTGTTTIGVPSITPTNTVAVSSTGEVCEPDTSTPAVTNTVPSTPTSPGGNYTASSHHLNQKARNHFHIPHRRHDAHNLDSLNHTPPARYGSTARINPDVQASGQRGPVHQAKARRRRLRSFGEVLGTIREYRIMMGQLVIRLDSTIFLEIVIIAD